MCVLLATIIAGPAAAMRRCGDHVGKRRRPVHCRCGDLLVSSRTLTRADRVTRRACRGNGLLVSADGPVTLGLGSRHLRGKGQGVGILVLRGTLSIEGPGGVEGFGTGLLARGTQALASVVGVRFAFNRFDGVFAETDGYTIQASAAEANGRDGFALGGKAYAVDASRAAGNHRYGFSLWGMGAHIGGGLGNEASANGMAGFWVHGMMHQMIGATSVGNGGDGIFAGVMQMLLADVHATGNFRDGVQAMGMGIAIAGATAEDNRGFGIWVMGPDVDDRGGNRGSGNAGLVGLADNRSTFMSGLMAPMVQCRIGMMTACR